MYIWLQVCQVLTDFNNFCPAKTRKKLQNRACIYLFITFKKSVANDIINVSLFAGPVCCEPGHWRVKADESVGLCRRWRRTFWTLLMIATLKMTMSKWQYCKFDNWRWLFVLFCHERKWTKNNSIFTEKCCYLNLRSKVHTQLRWYGKFLLQSHAEFLHD